MDGVEEMLVIYQPNENTNYPNDLCKEVTKLIDFFLERGLCFFLLHSGSSTSQCFGGRICTAL